MAPHKLRKYTRPKFISAPLIKQTEDEKKLKKKKKKRKTVRRPQRGVVYFRHIPHGFYEEQIKNYCSQFGKVTGLYLPRSKTGGSRGYAFVEFRNPEVAQIVADTMNNYLMFNRLLKAKYIPPSEQRPGVIRRAKFWSNKERAIERTEKTLKNMTRKLEPEEEIIQRKKILKSINKYHKKLEEMGLDYEFKVDAPVIKAEEEKIEVK